MRRESRGGLVFSTIKGMVFRKMSFFDRLERRWGWLAFPGFLRYYVILHALVFVLQIFRPDISELLVFNRESIVAGEVWRVVTMFFAIPIMGFPSVVSILLMGFVLMLAFMVSDALEDAWGSFKASLFYYTGILTTVVMSFCVQDPPVLIGSLFYTSAFFAFATLFPRVEILMMLILPVQVRFLAILGAAGLLLTAIRSPHDAPALVAVFLNYFIWVAIPFFRGQKFALESRQRRKVLKVAKASKGEAFHTCSVCGKTDLTNPHLEFRIGKEGEEYCEEHLPS